METKPNDQNGSVDSSDSQRLIEKRVNSKSDGHHSSEEPVTKKPRHNVSMASSSSSLQPIIQKLKSFADLPPEMFYTILDYVVTTDLLNCRLVNRQWNAISSRIMCGRDDIWLHFEFSDDVGKFIQIPQRHRTMSKPQWTSLGTSLTDLVVCLQNSRHFPFTSFRFDGINNLDSRDMRNFLTIWGQRVRTLKIVLPDSENTGKIVRKLLVEKTPKLKKIEIVFSSTDIFSKNPSSIRLLTDSNRLHLPELEVLCVDSSYRGYSKIIEDILAASTNLKAFLMKHDMIKEDLDILQTTKKLYCLKNLEMLVTEDLIAYWKKSPKCMDLRLQYLSVSFDEESYGNHPFNLSATEMLNQLFHSSKDVIQSLASEPLGPLTGLVFPKFKNLQKLRLQHYSIEDTMFPSLFDWPDKFPNVKDLDIEYTGNAIDLIFDQSLKTLPSIETLRISSAERNIHQEIMKLTPNVKTLFIMDDQDPWARSDFAINFDDIVTYLPRVENIIWHIYNCHSMYEVDAVITGLPEKFCKKLSTKFRNMDQLSADKVSNYGANRRHSSILDLKELRHLDILISEGFFSSEDSDSDAERECSNKDNAGFGTESIFYKTGFSKVSKFLGFDLVPNVKVLPCRIHFD